MAFEQIVRSRGYQATATVGCTMSFVGTDEYGYHLYIKLGKGLVEATWGEFIAMERDGTRRGVRIAIHEGMDTDAGFLMLVPSPSGYRFAVSSVPKGLKAENSTAPFICKLRPDKLKFYSPRTQPCEITQVDVTVDQKSMLIQVPEWLVYMKSAPVPKTFVAVEPGRVGITPVSKYHPSNRHQRRHS